MRCASLISGSKANSFYIETENQALLIDAGLSLPKVEHTLQLLQANTQKLCAVLLTHEHEDHIRHLKRISGYYRLPVYLTIESKKKSGINLKDFHIIKPNDMINFGDFDVEAFEVKHDADMCLGFVIHKQGKRLFYASDIGSYDDKILNKAHNADFIGIESNYDPQMLAQCRYPKYLKDRISGGSGHLSNDQARKFIKEAAHTSTKHVMFLHLSENSNHITLVERIIDSDLHIRRPEIFHHIGLRNGHTKLITI